VSSALNVFPEHTQERALVGLRGALPLRGHGLSLLSELLLRFSLLRLFSHLALIVLFFFAKFILALLPLILGLLLSGVGSALELLDAVHEGAQLLVEQLVQEVLSLPLLQLFLSKRLFGPSEVLRPLLMVLKKNSLLTHRFILPLRLAQFEHREFLVIDLVGM